MFNSKKYSLSTKQAGELNRQFALGKYAPDYESIIDRCLKTIKKIFHMDKHDKK
jgi:hypothetical protein